MKPDKVKTDTILNRVRCELDSACGKFKPFNTPHEGYAVILEELDELWELIKKNKHKSDMRKEAYHIAAMAIRFIHDLCHADQEW